MSDAEAVVLVPPELENGFLLAGIHTVVVADPEDAERETDRLLAAGAEGVVAVYEPYLTGFDPVLRHRAEVSLSPVVVPLPAGTGPTDARTRRARISALLGRAVGYRITFGPEEET